MEVKEKFLRTASPIKPDDLINKNDLQSSFWKSIFLKAKEYDTSDIHVENTRSSILIRFRVDGSLQKIEEFNSDDQSKASLIIRLKMICNLDISTSNEAQDKSMSLNLTKSRYRIALSPTVFGENFVFRVINDESIPNLKDLNLPEKISQNFMESINKKQGFICITGPTGSGKSTTLQAILMHLDRFTKKIITIENPVERVIEGVMQKEISPKVSWQTAIKMALREDPDIILIGEIRDKESASLALEAAQTGHLVLTTLHTNDVAGIIDRLICLGVDRSLIADNLLFATAQRLIPKLCEECKEIQIDHTYIKGFGCKSCNGSGIKGRVPVIESTFKPSPKSIIHFNKDEFNQTELVTNLLQEIKKYITLGSIDRNELKIWS